MAANEPFISAAPRPYSIPSFTTGSKGSVSQLAPTGTTSVWPAKTNTGAVLPWVAQKLATSPNLSSSTPNPAFLRRSVIIGWQPLSSGVTEDLAIKSFASCKVLLI